MAGLDKVEDEVYERIQERTAKVTQMPIELIRLSDVQVVRYGIDGHYNAHTDSSPLDEHVPCLCILENTTADRHWHANVTTMQTVGERLTLACDNDYWLPNSTAGHPVTEQHITCESSGNWSKAEICIVIVCILENTTADRHWHANVTTMQTVGERLTLACDNDYWLPNSTAGHPVTEQHITCESSGNWSKAEICNVIDCGQFQPVNNATIEYSPPAKQNVHSIATVSCTGGYRITNGTGNSDIVRHATCEATGRWNSTYTCEPKVCILENTTADRHWHANVTTMQTVGERLTLACDNDYWLPNSTAGHPVTEQHITCESSGNWSKAEICNVIDCGQFQPVNNATIEYSPPAKQNVHSIATVSCNGGYRITNGTGNSDIVRHATCEATGRWNSTYTCEPKVCILENTTADRHWHANVTTMQTVGERLTLACDNDYWLPNSTAGNPVTEQHITCESSGNWSKAEICNLIDCGQFQPVNNATITYSPPAKQNVHLIATVSCNGGYRITNGTGNSDIARHATCEATGRWNSTYTCEPKVCILENTTADRHWHANVTTMQTVGERLTLACDNDYWLPNSTAVCILENTTADRHWHAKVTTMQTVGERLTLACDNDYWLPNSTAGNPVTEQHITCESNGNWSKAEICNLIECGQFPPVNNATLTYSPTAKQNVHSIATVSCSDGYRITNGSGNSDMARHATCEATGRWNSTYTCEPKDCGEFALDNQTSHNAKIIWYRSNLFGDVTTISCNDGFRIVGPHINERVSENITCRADGRWEKISCCEPKDCGRPNEPINGWVNISNGTAVGNTATFYCDIGYTVVGNNKTTCLNNNTWNRPTPECKVNDCGNLTQPQHGHVDTSNGTTYLSVAVYSCKIGYTLLGNVYRLCYANKTWTDLPPTCIIKNCKDPSPISNGNYTLLNGTTTYESTVRYSCDAGYTLYGTDMRRCLANSSWTPLDVNCTIKDCFDNVLPESANITFWNGTVYESIATIQCNDGYRIFGRNNNWLTAENITCTAYGNWSEYAGCERKDCGKKESYDNASVLWTNGTRFESSAIVQCEEGYRINGSHDNNVTDEEIKCQANGHWSISLGCIKKECPTDIDVNHGNVTYYARLYRDIASIRCYPGYRINGTEGNNIVNQTVKCQSTGRWQLPSGCVRKDCLDKEQPAYASVNYLSGTLYEAIAVSTCREGYRITGSNTNGNVSEEIQCLDTGKWSQALGCERKDCGSAVTVHNAHVSIQPSGNTLYEAHATVTCLTGYRLYGLHDNHQVDEQIQCLSNGSWQLSLGCERKDCGDELNPRNANVTFPSGTTYQSTAKVQCIDGYRLQGQNDNNKTFEHIPCTDGGHWDVPHGCERKDCGKPHDINNGKGTRGPSTFESTVNYTCNSGYRTVDVTTLKCNSSGLWNNNPPNCTDIDECQKRDQNDCHYYSNCTNTQGSYTCKCIEGYDDLEGNRGRKCEDHNECEDPPNTQCSFWLNKTRACVNLNGGYICICNKGWNGTKCDNDINECLEPHPCGEHAHCTNLFGSYNCSCPPQYPQGNAFLGCFEPVIISFETNGTRFNGDNEILDTFQIPNRFPYFGTYYTLFRPSMDGFLALDFQPLYNQYGGETPSEWTTAIQKHIVIAPLWTNIDSRNISNGGLWIHVLTDKDKSDVVKIQDLVRQYTNQTEFNVTVALVATWKHVTIHSPYEPGYELVNHQNLSMQVILVTDGMYTYIMFNYDREQFSIRPLQEVPVASGFTHLDYSASVLSTRNNFTNLNKESNVYPAFPGRWLYNVTTITASMWNETRCLQFVKENNRTLKSWITEQLVYALPCPCQEVLMLEDYTFTRKDEILPGIGTKFTHTTCYESWFFSAYGIKQRCCYMFSKLQSQYPGAVAAEFENTTIASLLQEGYYQCCSPEGSKKYCHLYQQINPPDDCSKYTISDEIPLDDKKDTPQIEDVSVDVEKLAANPRNRVVRNVQSDGEQRQSESNVDSVNNVSMFMTMYRNLKKMFGFG
ncbi:hypothetical protein DPMN_086156 [Dreissena polymorpha]|uniref:Uncharacterized protein n=1 Tax=Dreissena polymorpha TaxID=45954 RepID=A0A9D3YE01_DREPO|nr:hypothetical protein DPMN_086156 [Dreissena polymorpha]